MEAEEGCRCKRKAAGGREDAGGRRREGRRRKKARPRAAFIKGEGFIRWQFHLPNYGDVTSLAGPRNWAIGGRDRCVRRLIGLGKREEGGEKQGRTNFRPAPLLARRAGNYSSPDLVDATTLVGTS